MASGKGMTLTKNPSNPKEKKKFVNAVIKYSEIFSGVSEWTQMNFSFELKRKRETKIRECSQGRRI